MELILAKSLQKMGYTLRFYRSLRGLSQMDLAHNAGLSFRNYQRLENGEVLPRIDTLMCLSKELGVPLSDLVECPRSEELGVRETFTDSEQKIFQLLKPQAQAQLPTIGALSKALEQSLLTRESKLELYPFEINGNRASICERFKTNFQTLENNFSLDETTAGAMTVDIWEFVSRKKLKQVIITHLLHLPVGLRLIESFLQVLASNPEDPKGFGFFRDCTTRCELDRILKSSQRNPIIQFTNSK